MKVTAHDQILSSGHALRVVILEDNEDDAALMILELRRAGFDLECTVVSSRTEFNDAIRREPAVILADYNVPGFGALDLLRRLKQMESQIPVIVLSGAVDEEVIAQTIKAGAIDYLLKDRLMRLGPAVANAIREAESEKERARLEASRARTAMQMHAVVEHLTDAVFTVDANGQTHSANPAARIMFGIATQVPLPAARDLIKAAGGGSISLTQDSDDSGPRWSEGCGVRADGTRFVAEWCFTHIGPSYGAIIVRDITRRKAAMSALKSRALRDPLTKLPNRALFGDRLAHAVADSRRTQGSRAMMLIDLDGFKQINDELGHHAGDAVLRSVGDRLQTALRANDTVARLGGDEFGVLLSGSTTLEHAMRVASKIRDAIRQPIRMAGEPVKVDASIGVALCPSHGGTAEALMRAADVAMYLAKREQLGVATARPASAVPDESLGDARRPVHSVAVAT